MGYKKSEWEYLLLIGVVLLSVSIAGSKGFSATAIEYGQIAALQNVIILNNVSLLGNAINTKFEPIGQSVPVAGVPADIELPRISFISPDPSQLVKGSVSIQLDASDNVGVEQIEIVLPSGETAYPMKRLPYMWNWMSTDVADGEYTIIARVKDKAGNSNEAQVRVTVNNKVEEPLVISFTSPHDGQTVQGSVTFQLETNGVLMDQVEMPLPSGETAYLMKRLPYVYNWVSSDVADGEYTITAKAIKDGQEKTTQVTVKVQNQ